VLEKRNILGCLSACVAGAGKKKRVKRRAKSQDMAFLLGSTNFNFYSFFFQVVACTVEGGATIALYLDSRQASKTISMVCAHTYTRFSGRMLALLLA